MPGLSNDFDIFPHSTARFGLGFVINESDIPGRRRSGSLAWAGLHNTYYWIDPESGLCAVLMTQVLPFYDAAVVELLEDFETAVYRSIAP
jgi:CubicO group peptidase (beta-lactamase class C family)